MSRSPAPLLDSDDPISKHLAAPVISYEGSVTEPDESALYIFPGIGTLQPGGPPKTRQNRVYSLAPSAAAINSNGFTIPSIAVVNHHALSPLSRILVFRSSRYTAGPLSEFVIDSQTLAPASPAITVLGVPVSLAASGSVVVIGSSTTRLSRANRPIQSAIFTIDGATYAAVPSSAFAFAGQTLTPGGAITVSGTPIFYPSNGHAVVLGISTHSFATATTSAFSTPIITLGGSTYTADSRSAFDIGGHSLTKDDVFTVSGVPLSYTDSSVNVVGGTATETLEGIIMSGFGNGAVVEGKAHRRPLLIPACSLIVVISDLLLV